MACNGSACKSNCYKDEEAGAAEVASCAQLAERTKPGAAEANPIANTLCIKCKVKEAISGYGGIDDGRFCADCFRNNLFGKFRFAVTSNAMIAPTDKVLVAFSGALLLGLSSLSFRLLRVALQFVHDMQHRSLKNFDASRDRSLPVFGVGVVFIDESAASPTPSSELEKAVKDISSIVASLTPPTKELHVVPIEAVYSSESSDGRDKLIKLVNAVSDSTGKEDLLLYLRMLALQKVASEFGYSRIVLGSCISRIARHVISATVKGQGYSLPADIQYVDARWEIPVVLPLRDCFAQEINMLCRLDGLKTSLLSTSPRSGINSLVSSFVQLLQEENPSRESTIVRTAGKLIPFHFNRIPEIVDGKVPLATQRRRKRYNLKSNESVSPESFCYLCNSPLDKSETVDLINLDNFRSSNIVDASCCSSCRFQILPRDTKSLEQFCTLLPQSVVARAKQLSNGNLSFRREQIQDCLLSDSEDET
ncbi:cytoplasmic tRNA 2-thiolation protein 2 [Prosopis cineraria]|uniref:cytoplasmic tRNA 2-thiolation protein 2 n=1 Tax=Prosopis cineraria TaxID=364024 RepID=UPI00240EB00B|nr:cytoplasmic tRNA 2-thiolation protein 2 [Prosopis cineraria]